MYYILTVRQPIALVGAMIERLTGANTVLRLAGDLSQCDFHLLLGPVTRGEISNGGGHGWADITLTPENSAVFVRRILPRIGITRRIYQIEIVQGDHLAFWSYDNFAPGDAGASSTISTAILDILIAEGALRSYQAYQEQPGIPFFSLG